MPHDDIPPFTVLDSVPIHAAVSTQHDPSDELSLIDLAEHFLRLSRFLYADATLREEAKYEECDRNETEELWRGIASPLLIGGSINAIGVTPAALNPDASMMCSHAWDFDLALSELTAMHVMS